MKLLPTREWIRSTGANDLDVWREHVRLQHPDVDPGNGWDVVHRHAEDHQAAAEGKRQLSHYHSPRR